MTAFQATALRNVKGIAALEPHKPERIRVCPLDHILEPSRLTLDVP